jgi:DNA replication protein DnaC
VLLGDSGTGNSHLLIGLGVAACESGRRVRYDTTAALVNELARGRRRTHPVTRRGPLRPHATCCVWTSWATCISTAAALSCCLQVLTERQEKASIAVASNAPFSEWGQTFTDPRLAAAIVDRLTFNALIVETGSESYRLRATHSRKKGVPQAV